MALLAFRTSTRTGATTAATTAASIPVICCHAHIGAAAAAHQDGIVLTTRIQGV